MVDEAPLFLRRPSTLRRAWQELESGINFVLTIGECCEYLEKGKALKRILIFVVVLLSSVAFALPVTAGSIDAYLNGPWLIFSFSKNPAPPRSVVILAEGRVRGKTWSSLIRHHGH